MGYGFAGEAAGEGLKVECLMSTIRYLMYAFVFDRLLRKAWTMLG
jgi:hypothetical protein